MSVIIRLQNLPWSANSYDIRQYFQGLSIPEGGVHIVGGELGDAFIAFSTDEDARQAMMLTGGKLKEVQVSLLLSSRSEMQKVIEAARSMSFPPMQAPLPTPMQGTIPQHQQQQPQQQPSGIPIQPMPVVEKQELKECTDEEQRESRKRTRSRSRDRSRGGRKENSRRRRSRSRSRDRDRRRKRSHSKTRGRDRYGRDLEKRDEFIKEKSKDTDTKVKDRSEKSQGGMGEYGSGLPSADNMADPFGLRATVSQLPFMDDRLTAAMRSTLSALNLPLPKGDDKNCIPGLGGELRKDPTPPRGRFGGDLRSGRDVSPGHGGFPDPGPAFGPAPAIRPDLGPAFVGGAFAGALQRPPFSTNQDVRSDPSQVWLNPQVNANQPLLSLALKALNPNPAVDDDRSRGSFRPSNFNGGDSMDDDFRSRFVSKLSDGSGDCNSNFQRGADSSPGDRQDRFPGSMGERNSNDRDRQDRLIGQSDRTGPMGGMNSIDRFRLDRFQSPSDRPSLLGDMSFNNRGRMDPFPGPTDRVGPMGDFNSNDRGRPDRFPGQGDGRFNNRERMDRFPGSSDLTGPMDDRDPTNDRDRLDRFPGPPDRTGPMGDRGPNKCDRLDRFSGPSDRPGPMGDLSSNDRDRPVLFPDPYDRSGPMGEMNPNDRERFERSRRAFFSPSMNRDMSFDGRPQFHSGITDSPDRPNRFGNDFDDKPSRLRNRDDNRDFRGPKIRGDAHLGQRRDGLCVELKNCPHVLYKEVRRAFTAIGCAVEEVIFDENPKGRRVIVKFPNWPNKLRAMKFAGRLKIENRTPIVVHVPDKDFEGIHMSNQRRGINDDRGPPMRRQDDTFEEKFSDDRGKHLNRDEEESDSRNMAKSVPHLEKRSDENIREERLIRPENEKNMAAENGRKDEELISDCVLVSNLPQGTTDRDICDFFSDIGLTPKKLHIMLNSEGEPSGDAYVEFWQPEQAKVACSKNSAPMGRVNVNVRIVKRRQMVDAVGLDAEEDSFLMKPANSTAPLMFTPQRPTAPRMMGPGPMPLFPNRPLGPRPLFPSNDRNFQGPQPLGPPAPKGRVPSPNRVVTMENLPYRAGTDDILEFFGPSYKIGPDEVFRKLNERGQPTSEARVVMSTPDDATRAVNSLHNRPIWDRNIRLRVLHHMVGHL